MSGSSGSSQQAQQVKLQPPDYLKPYIQGAAADASNLYQAGGPATYPGSTIANLSPETTQAWGATAARATGGSPVVGAAQNWATGILNGTSPTYGQLGDSVWSQVRPAIDSTFSSAGRYGSGAQTEALSRGFTEGIAPTFAQLQANAAGQAPTLANQDYTDLQALGAVGQARDTYAQSLLTDAYNRFQAAQQRPYQNLQWYNSMLYGNPYNTTTTSVPQQGFNWGGFLTGGLGALSQLGSAALLA